MDKPDEMKVTNEVDERQPYEAPRLEIESLFEVVALSCGKLVTQPNTTACLRVPRVS
jgi:hypothetical protein